MDEFGFSGGGAGNGALPDGVEPAGLLARVRAVQPLPESDGELQHMRRRVVPRRLPLHVQWQILPHSFKLTFPFMISSVCFPFFLFLSRINLNYHYQFYSTSYV